MTNLLEVNANTAEAIFKNGLFKLTLPKVAVTKAKPIVIKTG